MEGSSKLFDLERQSGCNHMRNIQVHLDIFMNTYTGSVGNIAGASQRVYEYHGWFRFVNFSMPVTLTGAPGPTQIYGWDSQKLKKKLTDRPDRSISSHAE